MLNNFKRLGVAAEPMNGKERLRLLHGIFHMDERSRSASLGLAGSHRAFR